MLGTEPLFSTSQSVNCFVIHGVIVSIPDILLPLSLMCLILLIKKIFAFKPNILLYGALPPRWAFSIARKCSHTSRKKTGNEAFHKDDEDIMLNYILDYMQKDNSVDFFIFGHRHLPLKIHVKNAVYFNAGDWLTHDSYLRFSPESFDLLYDKQQTDPI